MTREYETVIGLEVHVELSTKTKIFCGCSCEFGGSPNTRICPVCLGMPGALPVLNKKVLEYAIAAGLATDCTISPVTVFDRKNYFYPDNPQNYQISQLYLPVCRDGGITIETGEEGAKSIRRIRIREIHMEEDAGKLFHDRKEGFSHIDHNRAGVPLLEIVSEPDMKNAEEVIAYLDRLRRILQHLGISDCKLQEGSLRVDVNLSVREAGDSRLGVRTEMKNLNSFRAVSAAIESERSRQIGLLQKGEAVEQQTRRWDDAKKESFVMRSKEDVRDYRYFPDPDLPPVSISPEFIESVCVSMGESYDEMVERFAKEYRLPQKELSYLTGEKALARLFEETVSICHKSGSVSNWLMGENLRLMRKEGMDAEDLRFSPEHLAQLIDIFEEGRINSTIAKEVFEVMFYEDISPEAYVEEKGLGLISDLSLLEETAAACMKDNPKSVQDYLSGKAKAIGFLVGQTMKAMGGKADPGAVKSVLEKLLSSL
ncbi:MAG: Asp-tRNA(Asn)/Glu-tRNA(Gln) amidotransferase subunit GatB [Lachnospiraceae bacterium]|nr:Asp-tRNA(Asn)/Glu-tRNA(Gln) amidotransferase subunit GatB [Lachnospiraceae bacterium]